MFMRMTLTEYLPAPQRVRPLVDAVGAVVGLGVASSLVLHVLATDPQYPAVAVVLLVASIGVGMTSAQVARVVSGTPWPGVLTAVVLVLVLPWAMSQVLVTSYATAPVAAFGVGVFAYALVSPCARRWRVMSTAGVCALLVASTSVPAGAWSVDEPAKDDPAMIAGNGIVVEVDTHAFMLERAVVILEGDGRSAVADFLNSPDPKAPPQRDATTGKATTQTESYLWRMQLGSRDADRSNKPDMPDHFFNWWTHSGKGLAAGPSAAEYAEEQYAQAVALWEKGDRSGSMYRLGAAAHLVQDGCTPPHASFLVPEHRAYEDWVMTQQMEMKTSSGGIYRDQFRVKTGHGGSQWSSSHTRGWADECAHRAAQLIPNVIRPPSTDTGPGGADPNSIKHLRETKQLTAGYIAFFFDEVGGP